MSNISNGSIVKGMDSIVKLFSKKNYDEDILNKLENIINKPKEEKIVKLYTHNVNLLKNYPYIFNNDFTDIDNSSFKLFFVSNNLLYIYNKKTYKFRKIVISSKNETKYFFENLDNPLFVKNEFNVFNLNFLVDNVRRSEDVAYENHIYLYYDNIDVFSKILYYCDFEEIIQDQKVVFLFGEEQNMYPIDFKQKFNIDYESMKIQEVRPNEIKRIIIEQQFTGVCGHSFIWSIMDKHPNLIYSNYRLETLTSYALDNNGNFIGAEEYINKIEHLLNNNNLDELKKVIRLNDQNLVDEYLETIKSFINMFNKYISNYEIKNYAQWLTVFYLCSCDYVDFNNKRIVPTIYHVMHNIIQYINSNQVKQFYKVLNNINLIKYSYIYSPIRNPITMSVSEFERGTILYNRKVQNYYKRISIILFDVSSACIKHENKDNKHFKRKVCRFEDFKLNPIGTMYNFFKYFNIPFNVNDTPIKNLSINPELHKTFVKGFNVSSLYKDVRKSFSEYDQYFLEMALYPYYSFYGYEPELYDNKPFTQDDILKRIETPFEFEKIFMKAIIENENNKKSKEQLENEFYEARKEFVLHLVNWKISITDSMERGKIVPFKLIEPKKELMVNEIYTNTASLPQLENTDIDFLDAPLIYNNEENINE